MISKGGLYLWPYKIVIVFLVQKYESTDFTNTTQI